MANVLTEIAKKLQASGKRYTPRDLGAISRMVGYLGEDGECDFTDKKFRILNEDIAENEAYDRKDGKMRWPSRIELEGLPPEDIKVRVNDFNEKTGEVDNDSYVSDYLANFGTNLGYNTFRPRDVKITPYYGPFRDMYMTMSPDEQLEVAAPFIADKMAKDYEDRGVKLAAEDPDAWLARQRKKDLNLCERHWKGYPENIKKCMDQLDLENLRWLEKLQQEAPTWKKNIAEFRITPEDVVLDPLQYTESFRPDIRKLSNKLLTGED